MRNECLNLESLLIDFGADAMDAAREGICLKPAKDRVARLTEKERRSIIADLQRGLPAPAARRPGEALKIWLFECIYDGMQESGPWAQRDAETAAEKEIAALKPWARVQLAAELAQDLPGAAHAALLVRAAGPAELHELAQALGAEVRRSLNVIAVPAQVRHEAQHGMAVLWCETDAGAADFAELLPARVTP